MRSTVLLLALLLSACAAAPVEPPGAAPCARNADCGAAQVCRAGQCVRCSPVCTMACVKGLRCGPDADGCMGCVPASPDGGR